MKLIIQGMRRSGTTIAFDLFWGLPGTKCFYEPLAGMHKAAFGGGSGEREADLFEPVRLARQEFVEQADVGLTFDDLNVGAPSAPWQETVRQGPEGLESYLEFLGAQGDFDVVMKFTRLAAKVGVAHRALPGAHFLHIVRDPRRVAGSHLLGRGGRRAHKYPSVEDFFSKHSRRLPWSATELSDAVLTRQGRCHEDVRLSDVERVLTLWGFNFRRTHDLGTRLFGDRYLLVRHEDLGANPLPTVERIWDWLGRDVPEVVLRWAQDHVKAPEEPVAAEDSRWAEAVQRLQLEREVTHAGYPELARAVSRE